MTKEPGEKLTKAKWIKQPSESKAEEIKDHTCVQSAASAKRAVLAVRSSSSCLSAAALAPMRSDARKSWYSGRSSLRRRKSAHAKSRHKTLLARTIDVKERPQSDLPRMLSTARKSSTDMEGSALCRRSRQ